MSQQSLMQASVRAVTSTTLTYEGDWHALFDSLSIPAGDYNGRMLQYINLKLGASYTNINSAMAALAAAAGATTFQAIGTFTASVLTAPVLAFVSATDPSSDNTQDFNITVTAPAVDDVLTLQWDNNSDFASVTGSATYTIITADLSDLTGEITTGALADGAQYFRARHSRGSSNSAWSNTVTKTIDTTAPTLSSATDTATGQTTADVGVTTDEANGTLYCVVTTSSTSGTAAQVKAGQDNSSVAAAYASSQAISSTGVKAFSATGLTAGTAYTAHFMHEDAAGNQSTVVKGNGLTTDSAAFDVLTLFAAAEEGGWWDSSDLTTLFQHSNGTTAVASNLDPVGYWGDKSGNGNHLTQAAEAAPDRRPAYTTAFGVKGDGTSDWMRVDNMSTALTTDYLWVVAVLRMESYIGTYDRVVSCSVTSGGADTGATAAIPITRDVADNGLSGFRNSAQKSQAALATGVKCVVDSLFDGTNHTLTLNGVAATPVSSTGAFNIDSFKIMADTAGNVSYANVSICELIMVNRVPAGTEQADLLSHLTTKWSI